jgi:hypothetical protein
MYHGHGVLNFETGEVYDGEWAFDKRNGKGKNVWPSG